MRTPPLHQQVCGELEGMLAAVDDFRAFLGPELKAVTGDTGVIDEVSVMVQVGGCGRVQTVWWCQQPDGIGTAGDST